MNKPKAIFVFCLVIALLAIPTSAFAQADNEGQVIFGGSYTLSSGEVLEGDLVVFGGSVDLEEGSLVAGSVLIFGGSLSADGEVAGDVVVIGGSANLGPTAIVSGDLITPGGFLSRDPSAIVEGDIISDMQIPFGFSVPRISAPQFDIPGAPDIPAIPGGSGIPGLGFSFNPIWGVLWFLFRTFVFAALAVLVVMFLPRPSERVSRTVADQPILAGAMGILTFIVAVPVFLLLLITIILIPLSLLGLLLLAVLVTFGWIVVGLEVGRRLADLFNRDWPAALSAGVGGFFVVLISFSISDIIPCVGWIVPFLISSLGLGAVVLTRLGTQDYPPITGEEPEELVPPTLEPGDAQESE